MASEDSIEEVKRVKSPEPRTDEEAPVELFASASEIRRERSNKEVYADLIRNFLVTNQDRPEAVLKSLSIYQTLLGNIVQTPLDPKFRLLKRGKRALESKIFCHPELVQLLSILGFEEASKAQFQTQNPKLELAPASMNFYLRDVHLNVDVIENVLEIVREAQMETRDFMDSRPPPKAEAKAEEHVIVSHEHRKAKTEANRRHAPR